MADRYLLALLTALLDNPKKVEALDWTEELSHRFRARVGKSILEISEDDSRSEATPDYYLELLNDAGSIVDTVSDGEMNAVRRGAFADMQRLYNSARAKALGLDVTVKDIFKELGLNLEDALDSLEPKKRASAEDDPLDEIPF